jgi:hypothetical protein
MRDGKLMKLDFRLSVPGGKITCSFNPFSHFKEIGKLI